MKKSLFIFACISLILSACLPSFGGQPQTDAQPLIDIQGTAAAAAGTISAQTLSPLSTPELFIPVTDTSAPSETPVVITETGTLTNGLTIDPSALTATATSTPTSTLTVSGSGTPGLTEISITLTALAGPSPTGNSSPSSPTATKTLTGSTTPTGTAHAQTYGTLPPSVPYGTVTLVNRAKADVYVSLQVVLPDGSTTVLEFPVKGAIKTKAPAGSYFFVAWVGGKEMTGTFKLSKGGDAKLTFNKKSVDVSSN